MTKQDIVNAILSKNATRVAEAKTALKDMLTVRANQFRADSTKFVTQSLFSESTILSADDIKARDKAAETKTHIKFHKDKAQEHTSLGHKHATGSSNAHRDAREAHYAAADAHTSAANRYRSAGASDETKKAAAKANSESEHAHALTAKTK